MVVVRYEPAARPVTAPATEPVPALTAQVVGTVAPCTAQPPRMEVAALAVEVVMKPVGEVPTRSDIVEPAPRVIAPRFRVAAGVVPVMATAAPPASVTPLKDWALGNVEPVRLSVPDPMVRAVAGRMSSNGAPAAVKFRVRVPWLIVVEPE